MNPSKHLRTSSCLWLPSREKMEKELLFLGGVDMSKLDSLRKKYGGYDENGI